MKTIENLKTKLENGSFSAREILLTGAVLFLGGALLGVFFSPKGVKMIGSLNGCLNECGDDCGSISAAGKEDEE